MIRKFYDYGGLDLIGGSEPFSIADYNKRCAEFLGSNGMEKIVSNNGHSYPPIDLMRFHSDWNWIMEVVEAIEELNMEISILDEECSIIDTEKAEKEENPFMIEPVSFGEGETKKEAVVKAINQFLIWYNGNK